VYEDPVAQPPSAERPVSATGFAPGIAHPRAGVPHGPDGSHTRSEIIDFRFEIAGQPGTGNGQRGPATGNRERATGRAGNHRDFLTCLCPGGSILEEEGAVDAWPRRAPPGRPLGVPAFVARRESASAAAFGSARRARCRAERADKYCVPRTRKTWTG